MVLRVVQPQRGNLIGVDHQRDAKRTGRIKKLKSQPLIVADLNRDTGLALMVIKRKPGITVLVQTQDAAGIAFRVNQQNLLGRDSSLWKLGSGSRSRGTESAAG